MTVGHSSPGQAAMAARFRRQAGFCSSEGEPLYAQLLRQAAEDVEAGGVCWRVVEPYAHEPGAAAVALRFMAALHRLVLQGRAASLAPYFNAAGPPDAGGAWRAVTAVLRELEEECRLLVARPCQTNDVGRCAPLVCGFLAVARATSLPLRILEIGCSAGLNLRWDAFSYGWWGDRASPVRLSRLFAATPRGLPERVEVAERAGCDLAPIDAGTEEGVLTLMSFLWPSQAERLELLRGAIEVAGRIPVELDRAPAGEWLAGRLRPARRAATVVFHSVFLQYLPEAERAHLAGLIRAAGAVASVDSPLAWLRMEPGLSSFETRLTLWPGGGETLAATSGPHGRGTVPML